MISERKNDEIDSNSSESSPSRDTLEYDNSSTHRSSVEEILPTEIFDRLFDKFISANTAKNVTKYFQEITNSLSINTQDIFENGYAPVQISYQPISFNHNSSYQNYQLEQEHIKKQDQLRKTRLVYQIIKSKTDYWKADNLWKLYDKLAKLKEYKKSINSRNLNVLIIGAGPVGLRLSIECALLGYKCTVVEKRDRFSRNNVLHLWPYTIVDLKSLGAKMFYGKFCAGSIDHISIRKLQCVLLKAALLFGVKVHFNTSFEEIIEPIDDHTGWRVKVLPENHPLSKEDFDSVIGGDGRRNTLPGFIRKEFRGKLAIGITANFINNRTPEEADVDERSGVSYLFDQKFFNDIRTETNIDLENIVYYKDDTHYFVMTAKRQSLIEKGVILEDNSDPAILLGKNNVNHEVLCDFAKEAAYTSSEKKLNNLKFAKNHYGKPDVSMFDFTSLFQSENATRIIERKGKKLLLSLVGDSLLEPFWPTGSGIARGFLAAYDTAWALKRFGDQRDSLELLCERESIYQLLSQTTPENLNKNFEDYTIDPSTRYVNLNQAGYVNLNQVRNLYDNGTRPLASIENSLPYQNRRRQNKSDTGVHSQTLLKWCQMVVQPYSLLIDDFKNSWKDGLAFCAIIHRFRADLVDYAQLVENKNAAMNIKKLFDLMENKLSLEVVPEHEELIKNGINTCSVVLMILDKLYSIFKNIQLNDIENKYEEFEDQNTEIQNVHKRKYNQDDLVVRRKQRADTVNKIDMQNATEVFNPNKRNSLKHVCVKGISQNLKNKFEPRTEPFSVVNNDRKSSETPSNIRPKSIQQTSSFSNKTYVSNSSHRSSKLNPSICYMCKDNVSITDRQNVMDLIMHSTCFKCNECNRQLDSSCYEHTLAPYTNKYVFYCVNHKPIHKPDIRQKQVINNPIQKPDIRVDDRYNAFERPQIKKQNSISSSSPSPPARNLSRRSNFFNNHAPDLNDKFSNFLTTTDALGKFNSQSIKTPERAEFELATENIENYSDSENDEEEAYIEINDDSMAEFEDSESCSDSQENDDSIDSKFDLKNEKIESDTDESENSDVNDHIVPTESTKTTVLMRNNENNYSKLSRPNDQLNDNSRPLSRPMSCFYNYNNYPNPTTVIDDTLREKYFTKTLKSDILVTPMTVSSSNSVSMSSNTTSSSSTKLKKFNVNILLNNRSSFEDELEKSNLKQKQELARIELESERERNRRIIRDLVGSKTEFNKDKSPSPSSVTTSTPYDSNYNLNRKNFQCQVCKKSASITERVKLNNQIYHRECIRCCKCNLIVKNFENYSKNGNNNGYNELQFYCGKHVNGENFSIFDENNNFERVIKHKPLEGVKSEPSKVILDTVLIRQRALEKARLKSDEELGLSKYNKSVLKLDDETCRKIEIIDRNCRLRISRPRDGIIMTDVTKYQSKTESDSEGEENSEIYESRTEDDLFINDENNLMKKLMLEDYDNEIQNLKVNTSAPIARSETYEAALANSQKKDDSQKISNICYENHQNTPSFSILSSSGSTPPPPSKTKQSLKVKLSKLLAPSVLTSPNFSDTSHLSSPSLITTSTSVTLKNSGILKSIFNSKNTLSSRTNISPRQNTEILELPTPVAPLRLKKINPNIRINLSNDSSRTNSANLSTSSSSISSNNDSFDNQNEDQDVIITTQGSSFNALNVTNSPRLSRNSRRAKLNLKRQQNEEKRIEKQGKDQRLRKTQDLARKLDEIHARSSELRKEGNTLEVVIGNCDRKNKNGECKMKLEQELYNVIHQRNLLTRCENKLNIQARALSIEDRLSECRGKLMETMNKPETEKTIAQIESEKKIMEKIVEYIEEKNQLVEQLESLRILERDEDSEIIKIFSSNFYNMNIGESEIMNKFEPYADII